MKEKLLSGFTRNLLILFLVFSGHYCFGQELAPEKIHSLYTGAGFASNLVYMGTSISGDKPVYSGSVTYGYKDGLFLSASTYHLSAFDPFLGFHSFSLSYNHTVNSWFDFSAAATRYQVAPSLSDTLFNSFTYGNLSLGFDWKILYSNLSLGGVFASTSSAYLQLRNSRYFETPTSADGTTYFSFDPYINMLFGKLTRTETAEGTVIGTAQPFSSKKSGKNSSQEITDFFGLMEIDFGLPVALNAGRFTLEAEPGYVYTVYSDTEISNPKGFVLMLNFYFKIF